RRGPGGRPCGCLLQRGEKPPAATAQAQTGRKMESSPAAQAATPAPAAPAAAAAGPLQVSPKARRLAKEHGVDVSELWGSGPGGEIVAEDVLAAAKAQTAVPAPSSAPPAVATPTAPPARTAPSAGAGVSDTLSSIGRLMAERTTQSWTTVPPLDRKSTRLTS